MSDIIDIIDIIWTHLYEYGYFVRKNKINGLDAWKKIKTIFEKYDIECKWLPIIKQKYKDVCDQFNIIDEEYDNTWDTRKKKDWEKTHFFFQHLRIPFTPLKI
jgi:hypothetical protein